MISLSDNSKMDLRSDDEANALSHYAGKGLKKLAEENPGLLVFPDCLGKYGDNWGEDECLYRLREKCLHAGNVVGFFGVNDVHVQIRSRFDKDENNQYFFHYMLCRVFGINMLNLPTKTDKESIWDFLPFLFPYFLKRAVAQGIFRTYRTVCRNDDRVRGAIDVSRHIRDNIPFNGRVAYRTREYTPNNFLISLVRHTIEVIRRNSEFKGILNNDGDTRDAVAKIMEFTPDYNRNDLSKVIARNLRPVRHPFYTEYTALQKLCLQILRHEKMTFGADKDKVNGIVFKAEWLWEEYLAMVLPAAFVHPQKKDKRSHLDFYTGRDNLRYKGAIPDFYNETLLVIDAKYKPLEERLRKDALREDRFQLISYMHILKSAIGLLLFPIKPGKDQLQWEGELCGYGGWVGIYGIKIPQNSDNFKTFSDKMKKEEENLVKRLDGSSQDFIRKNIS